MAFKQNDIGLGTLRIILTFRKIGNAEEILYNKTCSAKKYGDILEAGRNQGAVLVHTVLYLLGYPYMQIGDIHCKG